MTTLSLSTQSGRQDVFRGYSLLLWGTRMFFVTTLFPHTNLQCVPTTENNCNGGNRTELQLNGSLVRTARYFEKRENKRLFVILQERNENGKKESTHWSARRRSRLGSLKHISKQTKETNSLKKKEEKLGATSGKTEFSISSSFQISPPSNAFRWIFKIQTHCNSDS